MLLAATERATPVRKMVRPPRAADDRSRPACGSFTVPEVMLTMRPNFLAVIRADRLLHQFDRDHHVGGDALEHLRARQLRKSRGGGPALLLTRMSGSGAAANSAACPSGVPTSAATAVTLAPVFDLIVGGRLHDRRVTPVDDDVAAGLG